MSDYGTVSRDWSLEDFPGRHAYTLEPGHPTPGPPNLLRSPFASRGGTGILTSFPSTTPFGLALGTDSPCADERCAGNLGLTATGLFTLFIATHVSIRTSDASSRPLGPPSQAYRTLSYRACNPLNSFAQDSRSSPRRIATNLKMETGLSFVRVSGRLDFNGRFVDAFAPTSE